ncbi:hypothetical protein JCM19297_3 [Nonlabens ulvanivorans]|nr:hypothetical protein [Nonlabens ulvanivorans]GAK91819.1 hypothetical protein JCM19297_3 [Nonlabens ulvanivorans]
MKTVLTILILFSTLISSGQSAYNNNLISNKTKRIVKKIKKVNELMDSAVYATGTRPEQWDNFEELEKTATKEELIELTNHQMELFVLIPFGHYHIKKILTYFQF